MQIVIYVGLGLLVLIQPWMWWRGWKAGFRSGATASAGELPAALAKLEELRQVAHHCREQWEEYERKAENYRILNSGILTERDNWQHLYTDQAVAHGNAQAMMMATIDHLAGKLAQLGVKVPIPEVLAQVQQDFTAEFVTPVLPKPAPTLSPPAQSTGKVQGEFGSLG